MRHPKNIKGYKSQKALAEDISNLRYDELSDLIYELAKKVEKDAEADKNRRGRVKLAYCLYNLAEELYDAHYWSEMAWRICKPYMKKA